jgi:hypothetical protein
VLLIGNINALSEMMIAQSKRKAGSLDEYVAHKTTAVDLMKKEALAHNGKSQFPAMTFARGVQIGNIVQVM